MSELIIEVEERASTGKNKNRQLRQAGELPAVVYGGGKQPVAIQVDRRTVDDLLRKEGGNAIFLLKRASSDESRHAMVKDLQRDPITGKLIHIDFQRIIMDQVVRVAIPVEVVGTAEGVKNQGGLLDFIQREIEVECLPGDIPAAIEADVEDLEVGQHLEAGQLELPEKVTLITPEDRVLIAIVKTRKVEEEEEEEEVEDDLLQQETAEPEVVGQATEE